MLLLLSATNMSTNKVYFLLQALLCFHLVHGKKRINEANECNVFKDKPDCIKFWNNVLYSMDQDEDTEDPKWTNSTRRCFREAQVKTGLVTVDNEDKLELEMMPTKMQIRLVDEDMQEITLEKEVAINITDLRFTVIKDCFPTAEFDLPLKIFEQLVGFDLRLSPGPNVELIETTDRSASEFCRLTITTGALQCTGSLTAKIVGTMNFEWFPFDSQKFIGEFDLPIDEKRMKSKVKKPEDMNFGDLVPNWSFTMNMTKLKEPKKKAKNGRIGLFSTVRQEIILSRRLTLHVLQTFIPSGMLCIASAGSVFIPWHLIPGRMGVCITTFLSLISLFNGAREKWIDASSLRAIDVWTILCYAIVFTSLIEYCLVLYLTKGETIDQGSWNKVTSARKSKGKDKSIRNALLLEKICRVAFPTYLIVSFTLYFLVCLLRK